MKKKNRILVPYLFLAMALGISTFYFFKSQSLKNELKANRALQSQFYEQMSAYRDLLQIDSTLASGDYRTALDAYENKLDADEAVDDNEIQLRISLAEQLIDMRGALNADASLISQLRAMDSSRVEELATPHEIRRFDSLSFVLEKTKVQLTRLQRQLQKKSFGEYLTFTNSKGSQIHYVGEVKNKKANGQGLALLSTGSRYQGEWKDNQRHGQGTFHWPDGEYYVGGYVNDKRSGQGSYYWPNGEKYTGSWKDDRRSGEGIFYGKDGKIIANGVWQEDELVEANKKQKKASR